MKRAIKLISIIMVVAMLSVMFIACDNEKEPTINPVGTPSDLPDAPSGAITELDGNKALVSDGYKLVIDMENGVSIKDADGANMFYSKTPAQVKVRGKGMGIGVETYTEKTYSAMYSDIEQDTYGYKCVGVVTTAAGSEFEVVDRYYIVTSGQFGIDRTVNVLEAKSADVGFASIVSFINASNSDYYDDFDYFIPSILYKDSSNVVSGAIASNLDLDKMYVKETRTGLPMVMAFHSEQKYGLALAHISPQISVGTSVGGGSKGDVNNELQYGAIGLTIKPYVSVDFVYPCTEGPTTYDSGSGMIARYHSVKENNSHTYKVGLVPCKEDTYTDAMVETYQNVYSSQDHYLAEIDMAEVYEQNIEVFSDTYKEYTYNGEVVAAGLPWSLALPTGEAGQGYTFQMGFVGQQLPAGYQMYRYGLDNNDSKVLKQGETIVSFWAKKVNGSTYFPVVWWDPQNNASGGSKRSYPSFLRCMVDGMEGLLDACRIADAYGKTNLEWKNALTKFASNLVAKQNDDGSFYRAYNTDGSVCTDTSNATYQGTSKLNTPIAVRFLAKMYEYTGEQKYYDAAIKAAEYAYNELYLGIGKYVGGTPDNPNTVDKEAAVYALYCFDCAYILTNDAKYLKAAEHAAVSTMSWTYTYDFAVPNQNATDVAQNPFSEGGVIGFSVIATGHSGADNYSAYAFYELYKLYLLTDNEFYKDSALLLQIDTKLSTDYDGRIGYKYKAMMPEATNVADFAFKSVGTWLPWSGIANIEPIVNLYETFGEMDILDLEQSVEEQKQQLKKYGCGGTAIQWREII